MGKREDVGDDLNGGVGSAIYRVKETFVPKFSSWLSARSYVMKGALFTQRMVSSIPIGGSIRLEGFLPPILLLVMIIAMVVVTVVVVAVGGVPSILKLSFMVIGVLLSPEFLLGTLVFAIVAACASRAVYQ
nr:hypothetical protein [Tanacetum cinerariifolium]